MSFDNFQLLLRAYQLYMMFMTGLFLISLKTENGLIIGGIGVGVAWIATIVPLKLYDFTHYLLRLSSRLRARIREKRSTSATVY